MIIDWKKYNNKNHIFAWFVTTAIGVKGWDNFVDIDSSKMNITLLINDIEIPIDILMNKLEQQLEQVRLKGLKEGSDKEADIAMLKFKELFFS